MIQEKGTTKFIELGSKDVNQDRFKSYGFNADKKLPYKVKIYLLQLADKTEITLCPYDFLIRQLQIKNTLEVWTSTLFFNVKLQYSNCIVRLKASTKYLISRI